MAPKWSGRFTACAVCEVKRWCFPRFAAVNPKNGRAWSQQFVNPKTSAVNAPWPERGAWVFVCGDCRKSTPGLSFRRCTVAEAGDPRTEAWDLFSIPGPGGEHGPG
jgi:hypothetical protein